MKLLFKTGKIACLLSGLMAVCLLPGCSGNLTERQDGGKLVTLVVGNWPKETETEKMQLYQELADRMRKQYPNIVIKPDTYAYDAETFLLKAASKQLPNLYSVPFTEPEKLIRAGYAADITETMIKHEYDRKINEDLLRLVKKDGRYYGLPHASYLMGMWYNVKLFREAGLTDSAGVPLYPQTYEGLAQTAKIIKERTGKAGFFLPTMDAQGGWQFMNIAWSFGASFESRTDGGWQAVFHSPEAVAALQFVKDLKWKYDVLPENNLVNMSDFYNMFGTGQVAMGFYERDIRNMPITNYGMDKDDMAVSPVPAGPAGRVALMGGGVSIITAESTQEQIDAAFSWLRLLGMSPDISPEISEKIERSLIADREADKLVVPLQFGVWTNPDRVSAEDALYQKYINVNPVLWPDISSGVTVREEEPVATQRLYQILDSVIQSVLINQNADPQALLDKAAASFQSDCLDGLE